MSDALVQLIAAHQRRDSGGCLCGWSVLGVSWAGHVAAVIRNEFYVEGPLSSTLERDVALYDTLRQRYPQLPPSDSIRSFSYSAGLNEVSIATVEVICNG